MELRVPGLAPGAIRAVAHPGRQLAEPCGIFAVAERETTVPLNAPFPLKPVRRLGRRPDRRRGPRADDVGLLRTAPGVTPGAVSRYLPLPFALPWPLLAFGAGVVA